MPGRLQRCLGFSFGAARRHDSAIPTFAIPATPELLYAEPGRSLLRRSLEGSAMSASPNRLHFYSALHALFCIGLPTCQAAFAGRPPP